MTQRYATPEELALARKIADAHRNTGWDKYTDCALAAIRETTERAAKLVENPDRKGREWVKDSLWGNISTDLSDALRRNGHLKQEAV